MNWNRLTAGQKLALLATAAFVAVIIYFALLDAIEAFKLGAAASQGEPR